MRTLRPYWVILAITSTIGCSPQEENEGTTAKGAISAKIKAPGGALTVTRTATTTATGTITETATATATATSTATGTSTTTATATATATATRPQTTITYFTQTKTQTGTQTKTSTSTKTSTQTYTFTKTAVSFPLPKTVTATGTRTVTTTSTTTGTATATLTSTNIAALVSSYATVTSTQTNSGLRTFTTTGRVTTLPPSATKTQTMTWSGIITATNVGAGTKTASGIFTWTTTGLGTTTFTGVVTGTNASIGTLTVTSLASETATGTNTANKTVTITTTVTNTSTIPVTVTRTNTTTATSTSSTTKTQTTTSTSTMTASVGDYGAACTAGGQCASGACSATTHMCELPSTLCSAGSYEADGVRHQFTSVVAVPSGWACPVGLLPALPAVNENLAIVGTCCVSWGPASCLSASDCGAGQKCFGGLCLKDDGAACSTNSDCASGACSATAKKCELVTDGANQTCASASFDGNDLTTSLALPSGMTCPAGLLPAVELFNNNLTAVIGTCCGSWGPKSCMANSDCTAGQVCGDGLCRRAYGAACSTNSDCASGACSATAKKCELATSGANQTCASARFDGNDLTTSLALPSGMTCPAGLLPAVELFNSNLTAVIGTCCGSWGPNSCMSNSNCNAGESCVSGRCVGSNGATCAQGTPACPSGRICSGGVCLGDYRAACSTNSDCASGACSPTAKKCELATDGANHTCAGARFEGNDLTTSLALPSGMTCPAGLLPTVELFNNNLTAVIGTCCGSWGPNSCMANSDCRAGQVCGDGLCRSDYGAACSTNNDCASGACSATAKKCELVTDGANQMCASARYDGNDLTTSLALPPSMTCPAGLLPAVELYNNNRTAVIGTCCGSWGPNSCMANSDCRAGQICGNGRCADPNKAPCTQNTQCASGACSPTAKKCEFTKDGANQICAAGQFSPVMGSGLPFLTSLALPSGTTCPAGLLSAIPLLNTNGTQVIGTCCATWGYGACMANSDCPAGHPCDMPQGRCQ